MMVQLRVGEIIVEKKSLSVILFCVLDLKQ